MTTPDTGYRRILLGRAPLHIKVRALESMEKPSERLLLKLIRDRATHPKLILLASDILRKRRNKKVQHFESDLLGLRIKT